MIDSTFLGSPVSLSSRPTDSAYGTILFSAEVKKEVEEETSTEARLSDMIVTTLLNAYVLVCTHRMDISASPSGSHKGALRMSAATCLVDVYSHSLVANSLRRTSLFPSSSCDSLHYVVVVEYSQWPKQFWEQCFYIPSPSASPPNPHDHDRPRCVRC